MAAKVTCRDQKSDKVHTKWHTYRCHDDGQSLWQRWKEPQKDRKKAESGKTLMPPTPFLSINSSWILGGEADLRAKLLLLHWIKFALLILSVSYWLHNTKGKRTQLGVLRKEDCHPSGDSFTSFIYRRYRRAWLEGSDQDKALPSNHQVGKLINSCALLKGGLGAKVLPSNHPSA